MLRSILTTFQNQKSKIVLWCVVVLSMLLFVRTAIKYIWSYKNIIATRLLYFAIAGVHVIPSDPLPPPA
jgi:hypothetical protein